MLRFHPARRLILLILLLIPGVSAYAQGGQGINGATAPMGIVDYEVVRRTKVYQATRTPERITIDGVVDERAWTTADIGGDFYQSDPRTGFPATEKTEFRILYDDQNLYISVVCFQKGPITVSDLREDAPGPDSDNVSIVLDTFDDDRNAFMFAANPGGGRRDQQIAGSQRSPDWDGVFDVAAGVQEASWTAEFAIPFKTLRFNDSLRSQRWGLNILRITRHSNEWDLWSPAPRPFGIFDVFIAGTLEGLVDVHQGRNLSLKPFIVGNHRPDLASGPLKKNDIDVGLDVKYGVTARLTLDLTLNTDFSQVEADEQQVNLTRFSLFFPEKREFFLENTGIFDIGNQVSGTGSGGSSGGGGGGGGGGSGGGGAGGRGGLGSGRDIIPFFSRRIGLSGDNPLPIRGGARLTGRAAGLNMGLLTMQVGAQGSVPADTWTVVRLQREVLSNSDLGGFVFGRDSSEAGDWNRSGGVDANLRFFRTRLLMTGFAMKTYTPLDDKENLAASIEASYNDRLYSFRSSYLTIEEDFRNDVGFVPRGSIRKTELAAGLRPRPKSGPVREIFPQFETNYITDQHNRLLTRTHRAGLNINFQNGDNITLARTINFERLDDPFQIRSKVFVPAGDFGFDDWNLGFVTSRGRKVFGNGGARLGDFWTGRIREVRASGGVRASVHLTTEINWSRNVGTLPEGQFRTDLLRWRVNVAFSPRMFLENFIQYNTDARTLSSNIRFRFIHHSLSDLFVVYNETRGISGNTELNRAVSLKLTNLFSF